MEANNLIASRQPEMACSQLKKKRDNVKGFPVGSKTLRSAIRYGITEEIAAINPVKIEEHIDRHESVAGLYFKMGPEGELISAAELNSSLDFLTLIEVNYTCGVKDYEFLSSYLEEAEKKARFLLGKLNAYEAYAAQRAQVETEEAHQSDAAR